MRALIDSWRRVRDEDPWLPAALVAGVVIGLALSVRWPGGW